MKFFRKVLRHLNDYLNNISIEEYREAGVIVGKNVAIYNSHLDFGHAFLIEIGDNVTITNTTILTHDASTKRDLGYSKVGKVVIGNNSFIGYGSIVLPNVVIGDHVIVGAGSVVRNSIPDNSVVAGNPAKVICKTDEYIAQNRKRMKETPVYHTYWKNKTAKERDQMSAELTGIMGFDF